jgi:fructosamine-3-kinase
MREIGSSHGVRQANGLRWLAEAGSVPVPEVISVDADMLVIEMLPPGAPTGAAARELGAGLARLHAAGAPSFGAPWPGSIAGLPLPNDAGTEWAAWYAEHRILPYVRMARDRGGLRAADASLAETVAGPGIPAPAAPVAGARVPVRRSVRAASAGGRACRLGIDRK